MEPIPSIIFQSIPHELLSAPDTSLLGCVNPIGSVPINDAFLVVDDQRPEVYLKITDANLAEIRLEKNTGHVSVDDLLLSISEFNASKDTTGSITYDVTQSPDHVISHQSITEGTAFTDDDTISYYQRASQTKSLPDLLVRAVLFRNGTSRRQQYRCPLCPVEITKPTTASKMKRHLTGHWRIRIEYDADTYIVRCHQACSDGQSHWHCPQCSFITPRRVYFIHHLDKKHGVRVRDKECLDIGNSVEEVSHLDCDSRDMAGDEFYSQSVALASDDVPNTNTSNEHTTSTSCSENNIVYTNNELLNTNRRDSTTSYGRVNALDLIQKYDKPSTVTTTSHRDTETSNKPQAFMLTYAVIGPETLTYLGHHAGAILDRCYNECKVTTRTEDNTCILQGTLTSLASAQNLIEDAINSIDRNPQMDEWMPGLGSVCVVPNDPSTVRPSSGGDIVEKLLEDFEDDVVIRKSATAIGTVGVASNDKEAVAHVVSNPSGKPEFSGVEKEEVINIIIEKHAETTTFSPGGFSVTLENSSSDLNDVQFATLKNSVIKDVGRQTQIKRRHTKDTKTTPKVWSRLCKYCGETIKSFAGYSAHLRSAHNATTAPRAKATCEYCGKEMRLKHMKAHVAAVHRFEKPHPCLICGKRFSTKSYLKCHLETHQNTDERQRPFSCNECGRRFFKKTVLDDHMNLHTGEKPYVCAVCGRGFPFRSAASKHLEIHFAVQPLVCHICNKKFKNKYYLRYHLANHPGQIHTCKYCSKQFKQRQTLLVHMQQCQSAHKFMCGYCKKMFENLAVVQIHIQESHLNETVPSCDMLDTCITLGQYTLSSVNCNDISENERSDIVDSVPVDANGRASAFQSHQLL